MILFIYNFRKYTPPCSDRKHISDCMKQAKGKKYCLGDEETLVGDGRYLGS